MAVQYPIPRGHFDAGANIHQGGGRPDTKLEDYLNDINTRLEAAEGQGDDEEAEQDDIQADLAALTTRVDTAEADIDAVEGVNTTQTTNIAALQAGKTNLQVLSSNGAILATSANVLLSTGSGTVDGALPSAATAGVGREIFISRAGANNGTVTRDGTDTIGAAGTSLTLAADGDGVTLVVVTTTRWAIKSSNTAP